MIKQKLGKIASVANKNERFAFFYGKVLPFLSLYGLFFTDYLPVMMVSLALFFSSVSFLHQYMRGSDRRELSVFNGIFASAVSIVLALSSGDFLMFGFSVLTIYSMVSYLKIADITEKEFSAREGLVSEGDRLRDNYDLKDEPFSAKDRRKSPRDVIKIERAEESSPSEKRERRG